jgi:KaiC/GvpD/RAD55 family RecA-like ATPase
MNRVTTNISGLDDIIEGGLPKRSAIALIGPEGSGKSLLAQEIMWSFLEQGFNAIYYAVDNSSDEVKDRMLHYGWDLEKHKNDLRMVDIAKEMAPNIEEVKWTKDEDTMKFTAQTYSFAKVLKEGQEYYMKSLRGKDVIVVFDSLSPFFLVTPADKIFHFIQVMRLVMKMTNGIGIGILHEGLHDEKIESTFRFVADGVIEMRKSERGHSIKITKMQGTNYYKASCTVDINDTGINIYKV